ncbi:conserved hypothetical protein [Ferroglobus placidus DSM 10642]|uniref:Nucleic acid binding OB-fold tRNA/helicase-type n=1 Tax=Ferroglobus placidus (strain DSM 10642 / AEDII12DO) TaxID=589924 RepID=D3RYB0_FERPA|nr:hypothetical protein [Ferroglobus placidus]ADC65473.1 conserved hypothetical protein [Ferroglobus placidus DSM 10642]
MIRRREVAKRVFAYELTRSTHVLQEENVKYALTPLGERVNRIFSVSVLLDKEEVRPDTNLWRMRLSDPTGVFYAYAGRFNSEAVETLLDLEPPVIVALVGKVRVFEGVTRKLVSVVPENLVEVESAVRDYWVLETAKATLKRIEEMEKKEGEDVKLAWNIYNPNLEEYKSVVKQAVSLIREELEELEKEFEEEEEDFEFEEEEWDLTELLED